MQGADHTDRRCCSREVPRMAVLPQRESGPLLHTEKDYVMFTIMALYMLRGSVFCLFPCRC